MLCKLLTIPENWDNFPGVTFFFFCLLFQPADRKEFRFPSLMVAPCDRRTSTSPSGHSVGTSVKLKAAITLPGAERRLSGSAEEPTCGCGDLTAVLLDLPAWPIRIFLKCE